MSLYAFDAIDDPAGLATAVSGIPGVLEHGLFVVMIDTLVVGGPDDATVSRL